MTTHDALRACIEAVYQHQPLVHCISATVSMDIVANGLLAAGARPLMTETAAEAPTMTAHSAALLINMGTLSHDATTGIPAAVNTACTHKIPWILDPTAVGLAPVRTRLAQGLLGCNTDGEMIDDAVTPAVIRGNASEIMAVAGHAFSGHGADAGPVAQTALRNAVSSVATSFGTVVVASGAIDLVADSSGNIVEVPGGHPMMTVITGTGCLHGAMIAACIGAGLDPHTAAVGASAWLGSAASTAAKKASGPGTLKVHLLDSLHQLRFQQKGKK